MTNELIFLFHTIAITGTVAGAAYLGQHALTSIIVIFGLLANLFVTKQITLFGLDVVCVDVFTVGGTLGLLLLQEYWGHAAAKKAIFTTMFILATYVMLGFFHLWYTPNSFDSTQAHFVALLTPMPRIIIASFIAYAAGQLTALYCATVFSKFVAGGYQGIRTLTAVACSQLVDTVIFSFIALYGIVHSVFQVIIISYVIKLLASACGSLSIAYLQKFFNLGNH